MSELIGFAVLAFTSLLAILNPLSAIPIFLAMTAAYTPGHRRATIARAVVTALLVLLVFALLGTVILRFFGITTDAFKIAGGIIFFAVGWDMLQAQRPRGKTTEAEELEGASKEDVGIIPLGIPTLAGPGAITTVIALMARSETFTQSLVIYGVILTVLLTTWGILLLAPTMLRVFGQTGLNIMTRIMGLLVMVVGVQFVIDGVSAVVRNFVQTS